MRALVSLWILREVVGLDKLKRVTMMKTSRCGETSRATTEAEPSRDEVLVMESAMKAIVTLNDDQPSYCR